jgi:hypothetical protein
MVPADIAIIGCDDIPEDNMFSPLLTSLRQPMGELGTEAFKLLMERIKHPNVISQPRSLAIQPELMARASCGEQTLEQALLMSESSRRQEFFANRDHSPAAPPSKKEVRTPIN